MTNPEWLRTDEPAVREFGGDHNCQSCHFWSRWLPESGDCLRHARQRRDAMAAAEDMDAFRRNWPAKSARVTSAEEGCDGWTEREGRGLSR